MPHARLAAPVCLVALVALLASSCGDGDAEDIRVVVARFSMDPAVPEGLQAVHLGPGGAEQGVYDLVPVEGGQAGEHRVVGGPDGAYRIDGPDGWWMLQLSPRYPELRHGVTAREVRLGRSCTVYLAASDPHLRPDVRWGATRLHGDGTRETVPVEALPDDRGYVVALRFAPEDWVVELELYGHLLVGPPGTSDPDAPPGPLAEAVRFKPTADRRPLVRQVNQAPLSPLDVVLVAASEDVQVDGLRVEAEMLGLPIRVRYEATCKRGVARFKAISGLGRDLVIRLPRAKQEFPYSRDDWHRNANLRLLVTGDLPSRAVTVASDRDADQVLVRPAGAVAFARVPFVRQLDLPGAPGPHQVVFDVPVGRCSVLLHAGSTWSILPDLGHSEEQPPSRVLAAPPYQEGIAVRGPVKGAVPGTAVRFFRQEGEEAFCGEGFAVKAASGGTYEALLPAGTYLVEVAGPGGVRPLERPLVAEEPGAAVHLPLDAP